MNQHPDDDLRSALQAALTPVTARQGTFDRVRTAAHRRHRRMRATGIACGTVLLAGTTTIALSTGYVGSPGHPAADQSPIGQSALSDCRPNPDGSYPPPPDEAQNKMAPGTPTEILVCDYVPSGTNHGYAPIAGWRVTGSGVQDLVTALNSPLDPIPPCSPEGPAPADPRREALFVHLYYDSGPGIDIIINVNTGDPCADDEGNGALFGVWKNGVPPLVRAYLSGSKR